MPATTLKYCFIEIKSLDFRLYYCFNDNIEMRIVNYCEMDYLIYKPLVPALDYSTFFQTSRRS
jgi:hypothetical protein